MEAVIYRPVLGDRTIEVTPADVARGFTEVSCPACDGTGRFEIEPGHVIDCVECSTRGTIGVSL